MKAVLGELPIGDGWAYELKWDGMRIMARCGPGLTLRSANGRDVTPSFPELAGLPALVGVPAVLDGEAVVLDGDGQPSFGRLQNRMHVTAPSGALMAEHPVVYLVFDLLELDGRSLVDLPYHLRRRLLRDLLDDGPVVRVPSSIDGATGSEGPALLELARQRGLEGVVAKRIDSRYQPGGRSRDWIKVKVRLHQELVVGGWLPGQGALAGQIGSLLVGYHEPGQGALLFAGAVGSGLTDTHRGRLRSRLQSPSHQSLRPGPAAAQAAQLGGTGRGGGGGLRVVGRRRAAASPGVPRHPGRQGPERRAPRTAYAPARRGIVAG